MDQKAKADRAVKELHDLLPALNKAYEELELVLGKAQNGPPDGEGDDTILSESYIRLRHIERSLKTFLLSLVTASGPTTDGF